MQMIKVNPAEVKNKKGEYLKVFDRVGRLIKYKKDGTLIKRDTHISRAIKAGDLVWLNKPEEIKKPEKANTKNSKPKVENKEK